ncbi:MAG: hypothetical protein AAF846_20630 [Chloroflexota bacterium]
MPKNKKHSPVDAILLAGEFVVWQGKANASTVEYILREKRPSPSAQKRRRDIIDYLLFDLDYFPMMLWRTVYRMIAQHQATYIITNQRVIVYRSRLLYCFVFHTALQHAIIRDSQQGTSVTWYEYSNAHPAIPPFMGLSAFDTQHVLNTVNQQINAEFSITDERGQTKTK